MTEIGGYFGLENNVGQSYHNSLIALNTGRNAFEYILKLREYKHIYIPYFTCDAILEPLKKLEIRYTFYSINDRLEFQSFNNFKKESGILYTNYFGLKSEYIELLVTKFPNLIIDACQAFFYKPLPGIDTFYSPRKFFGVSDGGYVSCDKTLKDTFTHDSSFNRFSHLLIRIDKGAEKGYSNFKANEDALADLPIRLMSKLTTTLMNGIDYQNSLNKRNENFSFLHSKLKKQNGFTWIKEDLINGPMIYPFYTTQKNLREKFINHKIYLAQYWPNIVDWVNKESNEFKYYENILTLPIDQRYGKEEMKIIIGIING